MTNTPGTSLQLPPVTASQLKDLWQVLVVAISDFEVKWTDGTKDADGLLKWYGPNQGPTNPTLWTHENADNWPKAIKISFRINDPSMPKEFRDGNAGIAYEVICTVGE